MDNNMNMNMQGGMKKKKKKLWPWIVLVVLIVVVWYLVAHKGPANGVNSPTSDIGMETSGTGTTAGAAPAAGGTPSAGTPSPSASKGLVGVAIDSSGQALGSYLTGANGLALYTYDRDADTSNCYDTCAANWPPYTVKAGTSLMAGEGLSSTDLTTVKRTDGSLQLAYKGRLLYYFSNDKAAGDVKGNKVGGVWFLAKP